MTEKYVYVVAVYVSVVGKDKSKLEDYTPDGLSLESEDYDEAMKFFLSIDVLKIVREWLHPNEKNYCVKVEKNISRYIVFDDINAEFDELFSYGSTPWLKLVDENKSITEVRPLTDEEEEYARV